MQERWARRLWMRLLADTRGGIAATFAMVLPVVLTLIVGAIDLMSVNGDRQKVQDVADAAALSAAKQLSLADSAGIEERSGQFVRSELAALDKRFEYSVGTQVADDGGGVTVAVSGRRLSFFANMLPPGGWPINVSATAGSLGRTPLCVLVTGEQKADQLEIKDRGQITANDCLVHSNGDIAVSGGAWLQAGTVQAAGRAKGRISPTPQQSGPTIDDPFASSDLKPPASLCVPLDEILAIGVRTMPPGVHCGKFVVAKGTTLKLQPGEHYFIGKLELQENAVLEGADVVLVFDRTSDFKFKDHAQIDLTGRKSGPFAGFVVATTRDNVGTFEISTDSARQLLGTIYVPAAVLQIVGEGNKVADQSPWTVVVAKSIKMTGSPNLTINARYTGSPVPVPTGVGPTSNHVALTR